MPEQTYYYASNINSFPTTKRESVNKLITENSLTRLINRLLDIDGFIISDGLAKKQNGITSEIIGNGGSHLEINANLNLNDISLRDDLLEFVIRGYYFSINLDELLTGIGWDQYVQNYSSVDKLGLYARIFIDNTNVNYPELVGQENLTSGNESNNNYYGVQFFLCNIIDDVPDKPIPYHPTLPTTTDETTNITTITGLGTTYDYYDLLLVEHIRNNERFIEGDYLPFDSLIKFDSHSVKIIDGGVF